MTPQDSPNKPQPCRVAVISDTHGVINQNIIDVIKTCDRVVHAGDICGANVIEQLQSICSDVTAVRGNNDAPGLWPAHETAVVEQIPNSTQIELPGGLLAIEHGHVHGMHQPDHASLRAAHPDAKAIVYGHTHTMLIDNDTTPWVINPGAAGSTRTRGGPSCLVLTAVAEGEWNIEMLRFEDEAAA